MSHDNSHSSGEYRNGESGRGKLADGSSLIEVPDGAIVISDAAKRSHVLNSNAFLTKQPSELSSV